MGSCRFGSVPGLTNHSTVIQGQIISTVLVLRLFRSISYSWFRGEGGGGEKASYSEVCTLEQILDEFDVPWVRDSTRAPEVPTLELYIPRTRSNGFALATNYSAAKVHFV